MSAMGNSLLMHRRGLIAALAAAAAGAPLIACSENPATGRRQFVVVTDEMLAALSAQTWADILRSTPASASGPDGARLKALGEGIAASAGLSGLDWEFALFESPEVNAFVLPGGKVGFFRGLWDLAGGDGEIAAVLGHEIGHIMARHSAERVSQQLALQLGVQLAAGALAEDLGEYADEAAAALGAGLHYGVILPYSRSHELEADRLGLRLMADSGHDPSAAVSFWQRVIEASGKGPAPLAWLSTHPTNEERLTALRAQASALR